MSNLSGQNAVGGDVVGGRPGDGFVKYPRTAHLEGSRHGAGDPVDDVAFVAVKGCRLVVEEKLDGANSGVRFVPGRGVVVQSRGHELTGGPREAQFELLKAWVSAKSPMFTDVLGARFVVFGEWMFAKHSMFYDMLDHFWFEFDVYDTTADRFLDTAERRRMFADTSVVSAPVLAESTFDRLDDVTSLVSKSLFISDAHAHAGALAAAAESAGAAVDVVVSETDMSGLSEGLYVKLEADGQVLTRLKWVRPSFTQTLTDSGSHWADRPLVVNRLAPDVDMWA